MIRSGIKFSSLKSFRANLKKEKEKESKNKESKKTKSVCKGPDTVVDVRFPAGKFRSRSFVNYYARRLESDSKP